MIKRYPNGVGLITERFFCAPGPRNKYFKRSFFYVVQQTIYIYILNFIFTIKVALDLINDLIKYALILVYNATFVPK